MRPAEGAVRDGSFRERLLLPSAVQWTVRVVAVLLTGIVIYGAVTASNGWERAVGLVLGVGAAGLLLTLHGRVKVDDGTLRLGLFPFWRTTLALREIADLDRVRIRPLAQMGVLGLGRIGDVTVLALRSGDAVRLTMQDGRRYAFVSERPDDLLAAVRAARPDL